MTEAPLLELRSLTASYVRDAPVLRGVDLRVGQGEIVTVVGPNGAGKSTVLKAIVGSVADRDGSILFAGVDIIALSGHLVARRGIGYVPQRDNVFPRLTVQENLELGAGRRLRSRERRDLLEEVFGLFPRLGERRRQVAGSLSGGERQMAAIARAMMARPRLLLLDEPSAGLSPLLVSTMFAHIAELNRAGTTILLVEQNARRALAMSNRGYVLELGTTRYEGTGAAILDDPEIVDLYLGGAVVASPEPDQAQAGYQAREAK